MTLYKEDAERILHALSTRGLSYTIEDKEFRYDDLKDLEENRGVSVRDLSITAELPPEKERNSVSGMFTGALSFEFRSGKISVVTPRDVGLSDLWYEVTEIIAARTNWYRRTLQSNWARWSGLILMAAALTFSDEVDSLEEPWQLAVHLPVIVLLSVGLLAFVQWDRKPELRLQKSHEVAGFWIRNKDNVILMLLSAFVGGVVTVIGQHLVT